VARFDALNDFIQTSGLREIAARKMTTEAPISLIKVTV
jgi:hypothetical protein